MIFESTNRKNLEFKICNPLIGDKIPLPTYNSPGSAGIDLRACIDPDGIDLHPNETRLIHSGIAVHIKDPNYAGLIVPRSGLGHRHGIVLGNLVGLLDSDYKQEIMISLWNRSEKVYHILCGERVAQLVLVPIQLVELTQVRRFDSIDPSHIGFGGSGRL